MGLDLGNILLGAASLIVGGFLTLSGIGGLLGPRLLLFGALTIFSTAFSNRSGRSGLNGSARWGWDNLQNAGTEGGPIPIPYGEDRFAPPVISVLPQQEGGQPVVYALYLVGHGPIEGIYDVELNDVPIASFKGADYITKLGTADQTATWRKQVGASTYVDFPGFNAIGRTFQAGTTLTKDARHTHVMLQEADAAILSLTMPGGIGKQKSDGLKSDHVEIFIEYRKANLADSPFGPFAVPKDSAGKQRQGEWSAYGAAGTWILEKKVSTTYRSTIRLDFPSRGLWAVRVTGRRNNEDGLVVVPTLTTITEVVNDARAYAGFALIGVRLPPTEQLNSGLPRLTLRFKGRLLYDPRAPSAAPAYSANNALVALDLQTNAVYGLGDRVTLARCDQGAVVTDAAGFITSGTWRAFADYCDDSVTPRGGTAQPRHRFSLPIDSKAEAREWLQHILGLARAALHQSQGKIKVAWDRTATATPYPFDSRRTSTSRKNIVAATNADGPGPGESSLVCRSLAESQRPNYVEVQYIDPDDHYRKHIVRVQNRRVAIASTTGTPTGGEDLEVTRSGAKVVVGRYVFSAGGWLYYVVDSGQSEPSASEVVTGRTSGATFTCTGSAAAAYATSPLVKQEVAGAGITRRGEAVMHARWMLNRALITPTFVSLKGFPRELVLEPSDALSISDDDQGWTARRFALESVSRDPESIGDLVAREYDVRVYADRVDQVPGFDKYIQPGGSVPPGLRSATETTKPAGVSTTPASTPSQSSVAPQVSASYASWYDGANKR